MSRGLCEGRTLFEVLPFVVARVTRMSEGCQIELRLIVLALTEKDASTELRCVTQNQAGRQEVVTHLQLEGKTEVSFLTLWSFRRVNK